MHMPMFPFVFPKGGEKRRVFEFFFILKINIKEKGDVRVKCDVKSNFLS